MQPVPDHRAEKTKDITDDARDRDERNGCPWIERFDEADRLGHVRPENEIENRVTPKQRPTADSARRSLTRTYSDWPLLVVRNQRNLPARLPEDTRVRNSVGD